MPKSKLEHVLGCSYFFTKSEADVLINSVLGQNTACSAKVAEIRVFTIFKGSSDARMDETSLQNRE